MQRREKKTNELIELSILVQIPFHFSQAAIKEYIP